MKEIIIPTTIGDIGGILYGQPDKPVILALHGWLDNAASFHLLAPLLDDYAVLALDLPGHGHSAWLGKGGNYLIWSYVPPIIEAIESYPLLSSRPFYILGHSLGTGVAMLIASVMPEKVIAYIALDSLGPMTTPANMAATQLKQSLLSKLKLSSLYSNVEQALAVRLRSNRDISKAALLPIVERNLINQQSAWRWSTDPRLRLPSIVRFTEGQLDSILQSLAMPILVIRAGAGITSDALFKQRLEHINNGLLITVEGKHHFHLEPTAAAIIAQKIKDFISHD